MFFNPILKIFLKKNRREVLRLVGLVLFLGFMYFLAHMLMQEKDKTETVPVFVIEKIQEDDTETDLRFPVLEETDEDIQTEQTVYEQLKTVKITSEF